MPLIGRLTRGRIEVSITRRPSSRCAQEADRALITRLLHIPRLVLASPPAHPQSIALAKAALIRLLPLVKATWDLSTYTRVVSWLDQTAHPEKLGNVSLAVGDEMMDFDAPPSARGSEKEGVADHAWVERVREDEKKEAASLDVELQGYLSNLIKESIRVSCLTPPPAVLMRS